MRSQEDTILLCYSDPLFATDIVGSVDDLGYFAIVQVGDEGEQRSTLAYFGFIFPEDDHFVEPGWYVVEEDSSGFIYWTRFEEYVKALVAWTEVLATYENFYKAQEEEENDHTA